MQYDYQTSISHSLVFPIDVSCGELLLPHVGTLEIIDVVRDVEWGELSAATVVINEKKELPERIRLEWTSTTDNYRFSINHSLDRDKLEKLWRQKESDGNNLYQHIMVGLSTHGKAVIWLRGYRKSFIFDMYHDTKHPTEQQYNLFDKYLQQFCYRYLVMFERWDEDEERWVKPELDEEGQPVDGKPLPEFDFIEEALWDGTHDKLHDGGLMSYHQAGKPKKLALEWHIKKSQYSAYLWFEDEAIRSAFEKFYGAHRDTKVDFIIRIDPEKNKYELALYRYGLQEPVVISEDAYQMIVFKSKFEYYRSENYDQPRGAWSW